METDTREERRSALEQFAKSTENQKVMPAAPVAALIPFEPNPGARMVAKLRDKAVILQDIKAAAAAAGDDWYYRFPVRNKKENRIDYIEGASIKLANYVALVYGNCDVDTRVQDLGDSWIIYARFIDFENGYSLTRPFQQRKQGSRLGGDDDGRRLEIAQQIGASKAIRNVICNALNFFTDFAFEEAKQALVERIGKELPKYRERTIEKVTAHVAIARVEAVVGRVSAEWLAPDVARVIALMKGVADGMASLDDTFPPLEKPTIDQAAKLDKFVTDDSSPGVGSNPGDESGGEGRPPRDDADTPLDPADAGSFPSASADLKNDLISKLVRLANDKEIDVATRIKLLAEQKPDWLTSMPADTAFVEGCFATAEQLAKGEIKTDAARRELYALRDA